MDRQVTDFMGAGLDLMAAEAQAGTIERRWEADGPLSMSSLEYVGFIWHYLMEFKCISFFLLSVLTF